MPVNKKKMNSLVKQYGKEKAKRIYYALENKKKGNKKKRKK